MLPKTVLMCGLLLAFPLGTSWGESDPPPEIRVLTFNVKVDIEEDSQTPPWKERKDLCAQVVREAQADLIGFQENSPNQLAFFRESLPGYAVTGNLPLSPEQTEYFYGLFPPLRQVGFESYTDAVLFFRETAFEKLEEGHRWLSPTPEAPSNGFGNLFPRILVWARLLHKPSGHQILVAVTHFDNTAPSQEKMAGLAHQVLQPFLDQGLPVLFLGDFNTDQNRGDYPLLTGGGWRDSYLACPQASESGRDDNVPTAFGRSRIDHVFYHGKSLEALAWERLESPDPARNLSDHSPVLAVFSFRNP